MIHRTLVALGLAWSAGVAVAADPSPQATAAAAVAAAPAEAAASAAPVSAFDAARRDRPAVQWQEGSMLEGDFDCSGQPSVALLGTSKTEVTVAVYRHGVDTAPVWLSYPVREIDPASVMLTIESLDFVPARFVRRNGAIPAGLEPSTTCVGLNLADLAPHLIHIFWNRKTGRFDQWRQ